MDLKLNILHKMLIWVMAVVLMTVTVNPAIMVRAAEDDSAEQQTDSEQAEQEEEEDEDEEEEASYSARDLKVMSCIIYCEANNQSNAGKIAVGIVVMNRVNSDDFPNTVEGVIRQKSQFSPVRQGKFARELKKYAKGSYDKGVRKTCKEAAIKALEGRDYVKYKGKKIDMSKYLFFSQHLRNAKLRIGGHDFNVKY